MVSLRLLSFICLASLSYITRAEGEIQLSNCHSVESGICKIAVGVNLGAGKNCYNDGKIYVGTAGETDGSCTVIYGDKNIDEGIHVFNIETANAPVEVIPSGTALSTPTFVMYDCGYKKCVQTFGYVLDGSNVYNLTPTSSQKDTSSTTTECKTPSSNSGNINYSSSGMKICVLNNIKVTGSTVATVEGEVEFKTINGHNYYTIRPDVVPSESTFSGYTYNNMALIKTEGTRIVALSMNNLQLPECDLDNEEVDTSKACSIKGANISNGQTCIYGTKIYKTVENMCTAVYGDENSKKGVYVFKKGTDFNSYDDVTTNLSNVEANPGESIPYFAIYDCGDSGCIQTSGYIKAKDDFISCYTKDNNIAYSFGCIRLNKDETTGDAVECNESKAKYGTYKFTGFSSGVATFKSCFSPKIGNGPSVYKYITMKINQDYTRYFLFVNDETQFPDTKKDEKVLIKINNYFAIRVKSTKPGYYVNSGSVYTEENEVGKDALIKCTTEEVNSCDVVDVSGFESSKYYINGGDDKTDLPIIECKDKKCNAIESTEGYYINGGDDKTDLPIIKCKDKKCNAIESTGGFYLNTGNSEKPVIKCIGEGQTCDEIGSGDIKLKCSDTGAGGVIQSNDIYYFCTSNEDSSAIEIQRSYRIKYKILDFAVGVTDIFNDKTVSESDVKYLLRLGESSAYVVKNGEVYIVSDTMYETNEDAFELSLDGSILKYTVEDGIISEPKKSCKITYKNPVITRDLEETCDTGYYLISNDEVVSYKNIKECNIRRKCILACSEGDTNCNDKNINGYITKYGKLFKCEKSRCAMIEGPFGYYLNSGKDSKSQNYLIYCDGNGCEAENGEDGYYLGANDIFIRCKSRQCNGISKSPGFYINSGKEKEESPIIKCIKRKCNLIKLANIKQTSCNSSSVVVGGLVYLNSQYNICSNGEANGEVTIDVIGSENYYPLVIPIGKENPYGETNYSKDVDIVVKISNKSAVLIENDVNLCLEGNKKKYDCSEINSKAKKYVISNGVATIFNPCGAIYDEENKSLTITKNCKIGNYMVYNDDIVKSEDDINSCTACSVFECKSNNKESNECTPITLKEGVAKGYLLVSITYNANGSKTSKILYGASSSPTNSWETKAKTYGDDDDRKYRKYYIDNNSESKLLYYGKYSEASSINASEGYYLNGQDDNEAKPLIICTNINTPENSIISCETTTAEEGFYISGQNRVLIKCGSDKICYNEDILNVSKKYYKNALDNEDKSLIKCENRECKIINKSNGLIAGIYLNSGVNDINKAIINCGSSGEDIVCSFDKGEIGYYLAVGNKKSLIKCTEIKCALITKASQGYYVSAMSDNESNPIIQCNELECSSIPGSDTCSKAKIGGVLSSKKLCNSSSDVDIIDIGEERKYYYLQLPVGNYPFTGEISSSIDILVKVYGYSVTIFDDDEYLYVDSKTNKEIYLLEELEKLKKDINGEIIRYEFKNSKLYSRKPSCKATYSNSQLIISSSCDIGYYLIDKDDHAVVDDESICKDSDKCRLLYCGVNDGKSACVDTEEKGYMIIENYPLYHKLISCDIVNIGENGKMTKCVNVMENGYYMPHDKSESPIIINPNFYYETPEIGYYLNFGNNKDTYPLIKCDGQKCELVVKPTISSCSKSGDIIKDGGNYYLCYNGETKIQIGTSDYEYQTHEFDKDKENPFNKSIITERTNILIEVEQSMALKWITKTGNYYYGKTDKSKKSESDFNECYEAIIKFTVTEGIITSVLECANQCDIYERTSCKGGKYYVVKEYFNEINGEFELMSISTPNTEGYLYYCHEDSQCAPVNMDMRVGFIINGGDRDPINNLPFIKCVNELGTFKCSTYSPEYANTCANSKIGDIIKSVKEVEDGSLTMEYKLCLSKTYGVNLNTEAEHIDSYLISVNDYNTFGTPKMDHFTIVDIEKGNVYLNEDYDALYLFTDANGKIYDHSSEVCPADGVKPESMVEYKLDNNNDDYYYINNES